MVKGTSRIIVMDQPRYISLHTPRTPILERWESMCRRAEREENCWRAWARCLITSVGTRTAQAATSPADAAAMCSSGSDHSPLTHSLPLPPEP